MTDFATPMTAGMLEAPHAPSPARFLALQALWRRIWHRRRKSFGNSLDWADDRLLKDIGVDPPRRLDNGPMAHFLLMVAKG